MAQLSYVIKSLAGLLLFAGLNPICPRSGAVVEKPVQSLPRTFIQEQLAIGFWVDPPRDQITETRYQEIADANFTVVCGIFGPTNYTDVGKQLSLCKKYGLGLISNGDIDTPKGFLGGTAFWGSFIADEPGAGRIPVIKQKVESFRLQHPGKLGLVNLFPNYASSKQLGESSYEKYVETMVQDTGCNVICADHYPFLTPGSDGREGYCENLGVLRRVSLKYGIPFWVFFNTMPFGSHYDPTESQLKWQIYTALTYGAKGILYFCYWTPRGPEFPKGGAIISANGLRTRHYDQAKRINATLKNLGSTLMRLTSNQVVRVKPNDDPRKVLKGLPIQNVTAGGDYLIGIFKHKDGRRAVLLCNYSFDYTAWPTVTFDIPDKAVIEINPTNGKEIPVRNDSPDMAGLQISLDSGEGRLFLLPSN